MLDKRIEFDGKWDKDDGTTVLWFTAPKEMLDELFPLKYPEAESMEISVELPTDRPYAENAIVEFSPTIWDDEEESYVDYDWRDVNISLDEIAALIQLANANKK
jgi:hypothetical protein